MPSCCYTDIRSNKGMQKGLVIRQRLPLSSLDLFPDLLAYSQNHVDLVLVNQWLALLEYIPEFLQFIHSLDLPSIQRRDGFIQISV